MRKLPRTIVAVVSTAAVFTAGAAIAGNASHQSNGTNLTRTTTSLPAQAKAYGVYCQNQSKKHVAGQKGTPFSQCVTAMAKVAHGVSFKAACAPLAKTHVAGQKGTPYSDCVSAAAKLKSTLH